MTFVPRGANQKRREKKRREKTKKKKQGSSAIVNQFSKNICLVFLFNDFYSYSYSMQSPDWQAVSSGPASREVGCTVYEGRGVSCQTEGNRQTQTRYYRRTGGYVGLWGKQGQVYFNQIEPLISHAGAYVQWLRDPLCGGVCFCVRVPDRHRHSARNSLASAGSWPLQSWHRSMAAIKASNNTWNHSTEFVEPNNIPFTE